MTSPVYPYQHNPLVGQEDRKSVFNHDVNCYNIDAIRHTRLEGKFKRIKIFCYHKSMKFISKKKTTKNKKTKQKQTKKNNSVWFLVNSYPSQLVPESTRTLFGQLVPKSTRTLVNSYPSQLVPFLKHGYYGSVCYLIHLYIVAAFHPPLPHHANGKGNHFRPR